MFNIEPRESSHARPRTLAGDHSTTRPASKVAATARRESVRRKCGPRSTRRKCLATEVPLSGEEGLTKMRGSVSDFRLTPLEGPQLRRDVWFRSRASCKGYDCRPLPSSSWRALDA